MVTLKERQFKLREDAIVDAMYALLSEKGYAATSMDDVATRVGISKATLYLHFKSKTELALKVVIRQVEESEATFKALDPSLPAIERLRRSLEDGIKRRATMGAIQIDMVRDEILSDPAFQEAEGRRIESSQQLIAEAQRAGDIRTDLPIPLIMAFIGNSFNIRFDALLKEGFSLEQVCEQTIDLVMRAIRP